MKVSAQMNSCSTTKNQLEEMIEQAAEKAADKAIREWEQAEYQAAMKKRKRGKQHEQS